MAFPAETRCSGEIMAVSSMDMDVSHANKPVPAPFLTKTYQLVDDPSSDHVVSWGEDGATFVVWRPPEFARDILPNYFKHNNFSSFVRQLNTYGFRKIVADRWEFANAFFRKDAKHLLSQIHRRKSLQQQPPPPHQPYLSLFSAASPPPLPVYHVREDDRGGRDFLATLSEDNQQLRQRNSLLLAELAHMRRLYNDIIHFLQNHVETVPPPAGFRFGSDASTLLSQRRPREDDDEAPVKLFGVRLDEGRKRRAHAVQLEEDDDDENMDGDSDDTGSEA